VPGCCGTGQAAEPGLSPDPHILCRRQRLAPFRAARSHVHRKGICQGSTLILRCPATTASQRFRFPASWGRKREQHHPGPETGQQQQGGRVVGGWQRHSQGVGQPPATLPTDAAQTAKLHRGRDGAPLPPCRSCRTMPPSLPREQCSWAPPSIPPPSCWLWSSAGCCGWAACARQKEQTPQRAHGNTNLLFPPCCALEAEENRYRTPGRNHGGGNDACNTRKARGHTDGQKHGSTKPGPEHSSTHTQQHPQPSAPSPTAAHSERNACGAGSPAAARGCSQALLVLCAPAAFLQHRGCAHLWAVPCSEGYGHRLALSARGTAVAVPPGHAGSLARARSTLNRCLGCRKALWCIPRDNLGGRGCGVRGFHTALPSTQ
ncbi:hypothetical protein CIB84_014978, partial [Bambusicola thoracicus]